MVTQRIFKLLRLRRSWIAVAAFAMLGSLVWVVQVYGPTAAQAETVVKTYPCPAGQLTTLAEHLREELNAVEGVRVAADTVASQLVVQAPQDVQAWVAKRLAASADVKAATTDPQARNLQTRTIALQRGRPDQLETAIGDILGERLTAISAQRDSVRSYSATLADGSLELTFDSTASQIKLKGTGAVVDAAERLIQILDGPPETGRNVRVLPVHSGRMADVQRATAAMRTVSSSGPATLAFYQPPPAKNIPPTPAAPAAPDTAGPSGPASPAPGPGGRAAGGEGGSRNGLINPVQIEMLSGLDVLVLRGNPQDIAQVAEIIQQVERLSAVTQPEIKIVPVRQVDCETLAVLLRNLYDEVFRPRQGNVSITPVITPNALLVVGRKENVQTVEDLVGRLDLPAIPDAQFRVFHLRYANVSTAQSTVQSFFPERGGLGPVVRATADTRSNALIVQASPRDMLQVVELINRIDTMDSNSINEVRIIRLEHAMASDVAYIMQSAIGATTGGVMAAQQGGATTNQTQPLTSGGTAGQRAAMLRFLTIDAKGRRILNSGILSDVKITADARANALIVSAPPENMELIEALVRQIDLIPAAEAQIKVFTIVNGDASNLADMLRSLFGLPTSQAGGGGGLMQSLIQTTTAGGENTVVTLRFAVDIRTNSIIASGTMGDLNVVEAILTKLDDSDVRKRKSVVVRLKNSPATDVATTINNFLTTQRQFEQSAPGLTSVYEEVEREVAIVAEPVTNSLVLSATPRFFEEIKGIIDQLDARPQMVAIQVLIASVNLGNTNEFGIELGLQDSALFDRSILSNPVVTSTTLPNGTTTQTVIAANNAPGFNFNDTANPLGNSGLGTNLSPHNVAGQSLTNLALGRQNTSLGYGGMVLSAQSQNVSMLVRALAENHKVEVLERPQITTMDNQPAVVQVGQRVPTIQSVSTNTLTGQVNTVTFQNVGVILGVTPRISPDGMVVMQIDAEKSALEPEATGIPIFSSPTGQVVRSPIIDSTTAQTTVSAMDGQTIVLGGLISKSRNESHRSVPFLGDLPVIGNLFRFDSVSNDRTELLIILTPHIIRNACDMEALKRAEAARMSWCLCDVTKLYGEAGLHSRTETWGGGDVKVIYPDSPEPQVLPGGPTPETLPTPQGAPRNLTPPQPTPQPLAPVPGGVPPTGNPTSVVPRYETPSAPNPPGYPPVAPPTPIEPATYQGSAGTPAQPVNAASQDAVYRQPAGPAPYQPPFAR